jgi:hypothetical protein
VHASARRTYDRKQKIAKKTGQQLVSKFVIQSEQKPGSGVLLYDQVDPFRATRWRSPYFVDNNVVLRCPMPLKNLSLEAWDLSV